jgi:16S rRNA (adenine1518-N6/adenine1519-N6)-dimethyltransferase
LSRQKLGQHFLVKGSILERIAAAACPEPVPLVIEIGPGRGALTRKLLERAERVVAIELDPYLAAYLREKFPSPCLEVLQADAREIDFTRFGAAPIAGNLPYYAATPIIERIAALRASRAVFLIQKEVAERIAATPGTRPYGYLTVAIQLYAGARLLFEVKPSAFHPPPKVDSAVLRLDPRPETPRVPDAAAFLAFVSLCFHQKRKTLRNNLAAAYGAALIDSWPEARLRAEQLSLAQFLELYSRVPPS